MLDTEQAKRMARGEREDELVRFMRHVEERGDCWVWKGHVARSPNGTPYGVFTAWRDGRWRPVRAHRFAYERLVGPPEHPMVLHTCDQSLCVNPAHLYSGTGTDNARDRDSRGRANTPRGERNGHAKLTAKAAEAIRTSTESQRQLAERYGVNQAQISRIRTGKIWRSAEGVI